MAGSGSVVMSAVAGEGAEEGLKLKGERQGIGDIIAMHESALMPPFGGLNVIYEKCASHSVLLPN